MSAPESRRVVVTGMGVLSPVGSDVASFGDAILAGRSGVETIARVRRFEVPLADCRPDPRVRSSAVLRRQGRRPYRSLRAFCRRGRRSGAARQRACPATTQLRSTAGVAMGTGLGGINSNDHEFKTMYTKGHRLVSPWAIPMIMYNAAASHVAMRFGLHGPNFTVTTACSSSSNALGQAYRTIKHGYADLMVAGGSDAPITPGILAAWCALRALSIRNDNAAERVPARSAPIATGWCSARAQACWCSRAWRARTGATRTSTARSRGLPPTAMPSTSRSHPPNARPQAITAALARSRHPARRRGLRQRARHRHADERSDRDGSRSGRRSAPGWRRCRSAR